MVALDLTPFGYTPTENLVYEALLELGPASGYAIAKHVSIARANAYQALNGLVSKGAADLVDATPRRFRPLQPRALLARISDATARQVDRLEEQVQAAPASGRASVVPLSGHRSVQDLATRMIVRSAGELRCIAPAELLRALIPAWRKREADGAPSAVWVMGEVDGLAVTTAGTLDPARVAAFFPSQSFLLVASEAALVADLTAEPSGYWTSEWMLVGALRAAVLVLTT